MLAWSRSGLAAVVCIAVVLRHVWPLHGTDQYVALGLVAGAAAAWAAALLVFLHSGSNSPADGALGERGLRLITLGTEVLAVVGFLLAVVASP